MAQLQELAPVLNDILLIVIAFGLVGYWAYKVATYNWDNFEEDSKNDDFMRPWD